MLDFQSRLINLTENKFNKKNFFFHIDFFNHGIPTRFFFNDENLRGKLRGYYPESWFLFDKYFKPEKIIYWLAPSEINSSIVWEDVADSDCFFYADNWICQRDFITKKLDESSQLLITKNEVDDGYFNFLRYFLPQLFLQKEKVLFHSSCVVDRDDMAYVFFGYSGAGKTTISQLCSKGTVIGDDMNLLSSSDNKLWIEPALVGQRFYNKSTFGNKYEIKKMFWLKKSDQIFSQNTDAKVAKILSSFSGLFWDRLDNRDIARSIELAKKISEHVKIEELNFNLKKEVWDYVRSNADL